MLNTIFLLPFLAFSSVLAKNNLPSDTTPAPPPLQCDGAEFKSPVVTGAKIVSITAEQKFNYTSFGGGPLLPSVQGLSFCLVKVTLNHPGTDDNVTTEIWLPLTRESWNGRFQATSGGGFATGLFGLFLGPAIRDGYAASSTDGGHSAGFLDTDWLLVHDAEKNAYSVNWNLLHNFATRSLSDQVYIGKSITEQYFKEKPHHSYWNGCSQGGRQGYMMAQKYPGLLDGILAAAPGIGLQGLAMADFWPQLLMIESQTFMSNCEFDWFGQKAIDKCDMIDGVSDGVITDPTLCDFDPNTLVGQKFQCDEKDVEVTQIMADIVRKIQEGPKTPSGTPIWPGLPYGTSMRGVADIAISPEGVRSPKPFGYSLAHIQKLLLRNPTFNISTLTYETYVALWAQSAQEYSWLLDAESPDLTGLRDAGTKLLSWHGINDQLVSYEKTIQYRQRVEMEMGGAKVVDEYYRLFLAPGVMHCGFGSGPTPNRALKQLEDWVENGEVPETLDSQTKNADGELVSRDLCRWPRKLKYMGLGDAKRASSWSCEGEEDFEDMAGEDTGKKVKFLGGLKERLMGLGLGLRIQ
ncbi:tannase and feruloyl esterase [Pleomassaria siparia CBS 279.74]|uniref:Carboxylic ester hydrolase n=1 Tax=Pleomassaria siparia CBS 279.74 TaxID=1314801 RepID=A0A6G1KLX7_9PLEO|nr:tannase and feruloyl esterase [Pleomassaria siparia CBS 279.74]